MDNHDGRDRVRALAELAEARGFPYWAARALLRGLGRGRTEGFASPDLVEARALLKELGAAPENDAERVRSAAAPTADPEVSGGSSGPSPVAP